jgi:hypothetical protein
VSSEIRREVDRILAAPLRRASQSVWAAIRGALRQEVAAFARAMAPEDVRARIEHAWRFDRAMRLQPLGGQFQVGDLAACCFARDHLGAALEPPWLDEALDLMCTVARSCGGLFAFGGELCVMLDRPERLCLAEDPGGPMVERRVPPPTLHAADGPALRYRDGWEAYFLRGVRVPRDVVEAQQSITLRRIDTEPDPLLRWLLIEQFGVERYLRRRGTLCDELPGVATLFRAADRDEGELRVVRLVNATTRADGTREHFMLRVPPGCATAAEAVSWSFGLDARAYRPVVET